MCPVHPDAANVGLVAPVSEVQQPFSGEDLQAPGLLQPLADEDLAVCAVELGDLDGVGRFVTPVEVARHPVHGDPVGVTDSGAVKNLRGK